MRRALSILCCVAAMVPIPVYAQQQNFPGGGSSSKLVLDARDYGVKGDGVTDDTAAMQSAINAACNSGGTGSTLTWPNTFGIKVTSTLTVTKCVGLTIDGLKAQGSATIAPAAGTGSSAILWYGSAGAGSVLQINQTRDSTFKNFTIFSNASNYHNSGANTGILIDEIGTVTTITTNNYFDNVQVYNGNAQNSSFIGVDICPTAPANCEAQNFDRLIMQCGGGTVTASSNGVGIKYEGAGGAQAFYEYVHWIESTNCSQAIDIEAGNEVDIDGGFGNGNFTDLFVNGGRNISYRHVRSELANSQIVIGTASASSAHDLTIEENSFAGLTNSTTTISFPFNNTLGTIRVLKNDWDANATVTPFGPTGGGVFQGVYDSEANNYPNSTLCPVVSSANLYYFNMDRTACTAQYTQFGGTSITGVKLTGLLAMYNSSAVNVGDFFTEGSNFQMISELAGQGAGLSGDIGAGVATAPAVVLGNGNNITNTAGYSVGVAVGSTVANNAFLTFAPTSGAGDFVAELIQPTINQTASASGNPTALGIYPVNTAILGAAPLLIGAGSASAVGGTRTNKFTVDNNGNSSGASYASADLSFGSSQFNGPAACETSFGITTLATGATTTNTGLNCLPANSIIDAVVYRITTTITTAANFTIGDSTTATRFCSTQSTLTAGTTGVCFAQADQTGAGGPRQVAATSVRVTTNVNPGAGAIRLIAYYHTWTPPTS